MGDEGNTIAVPFRPSYQFKGPIRFGRKSIWSSYQSQPIDRNLTQENERRARRMKDAPAR